MGVHIGATWQIWLNRRCAAAMQPFCQITLSLWPRVSFPDLVSAVSVCEMAARCRFDCLHTCTVCHCAGIWVVRLARCWEWSTAARRASTVFLTTSCSASCRQSSTSSSRYSTSWRCSTRGSPSLSLSQWPSTSVSCWVLLTALSLYMCHSQLIHCWLGGRRSIWPVKNEWWGAGVVICLERDANDLHIVQLMPLPPHLLLLH